MIEAELKMSSPTMFHDLESPPGTTQQDERALQIALELSSLGLLGTGDDDSSTSSYDEITKSKKSQNMTECVPVPSSEHVAEIVGRQGCKIKALRAKTSTYIKTPVRGEEPVFVVTGRKEDVAMARREIQSAAEHFTQIRATRNKAGLQNNGVPPQPLSGLAYPMPISSGNTSPTDLASPGTITLQVRVPYRVVGLVVGPKGATIKRIQQQTHTYIVTPSRDKEPVFEVTGLPENVEKAKEEIEAHIAARTGNQSRDTDDDFASNGTVVGSPASFNRSQSAFTPYRSNSLLGQTRPELADANFRFNMPQIDNPFFSQMQGYSKYPQTQTQQGTLLDMAQNGALNMYGQNGRSVLDQYDPRTDTSTAMAFDAATNPATSWALSDLSEIAPFPMFSAASDTATTNVSSLSQQVPLNGSMLPSRLSPTLSDSDFPLGPLHPGSSVHSPLSNMTRPPMRRVGSDSVDSTGSSIDFGTVFTKTMSNGINIESGYSSAGTTDSQTSGSPVENICGLANLRTASPPRVCVLCHETSVTAALVPCGHNLFCYECAEKALRSSAICPCCNKTATMALRIKTEPAA